MSLLLGVEWGVEWVVGGSCERGRGRICGTLQYFKKLVWYSTHQSWYVLISTVKNLSSAKYYFLTSCTLQHRVHISILMQHSYYSSVTTSHSPKLWLCYIVRNVYICCISVMFMDANTACRLGMRLQYSVLLN